MIKYLKLMRVHHYIKNGLLFLPLVFSGKLFVLPELAKCLSGFVVFSFACSIIYIINDIQDYEKDRLHDVKKKRPIASGEVSLRSAWITVAVLSASVILLNLLTVGFSSASWVFICIYIVLNLLYSYGLKNIPLIDITILVSGFLLRVLYGSAITNIAVSNWLYLTVMSGSFYLGLGKRRNEIQKQNGGTRAVLKYYSHSFLDKNMHMCLTLTVVFYSLWCVDPNTIARLSSTNIIWTVPLVLLIIMKYSLNMEGSSYGDPVDVILGDKVLMLLIALYALITLIIIYHSPVISLWSHLNRMLLG